MKLVRTLGMVLALALCFALNSINLYGQAVNGTVVGTIDDGSGAVVSGAKVVLTEMATAVARSTQSNQSGNYEFANLPPGGYKVTVEHEGFKKAERFPVDVLVNSTVRVNLTLQAGAVAETVEVTGELPLLQTERADVATKIETKQFEQLPIGGANRNFQSLLALVPGTVRPHRDHSEFFNAQDTLSTEVNGQSREFNQLMIEGVNDDERTGLLQIYVPPAEAIQTVDVSTNNYAAEFGRAGGAVTNVQLKSGTNAFHGSAYEYNRVSALFARSYFNRPPNALARSTYNYYGGTVGGPIFKNKTFFFFDILRIDDIRGQFNRQTVPIDAFRNGDFRSAGVNIYDPQTGNPDGTGRAQFVAFPSTNPVCTTPTGCPNVIPVARFSPIALRILALIPHANLPGTTNNYAQNTELTKHPWSFDTKIDHNFSASDRIAFRFSRAIQKVFQQPIFGLAGGPANGSFQGTGIQHEQSGAVNWTHIFSPSLVMEARGGISHYRNIARSADFGSKATDALGIPGANLNDFTSGLTGIRILSVNGDNPIVGYSASLPWDRGETNIDMVSNWTKISGNHTFKWGANVRRLRDDLVQAQTFGPRGRFDFGTGTTSISGQTSGLGNNFAALLIDQPTSSGRDVSLVSGSWRETEAFFYGQDTWKATNKFTIDAGLRWELYLPPTPSRAGRYSNYDPTTNRLVLAGIAGNPKNLGRQTYYKYFAPRLGLAYRLDDKTVFRSGFGISYQPFTNNGYAFNFPVRQNQGTSQSNSFAIPTFANGQVAIMANGFPAPLPVAIASDGTVTPNNGEDYNVIDKHFQQPYVESWNLAAERSLPWNFVLDAAYVGNHGVKIPVAYNLNAATAPGVNPNGTLATTTCPFRPLCAQFGRTGAATFLFRPTTSNYNSLQVKLNRRWTNGFLLTTSYTWGKDLAYRADAGSDDGGAVNYIDFKRNYSIMSRNRLHTFVTSYVYELPFGKNKPWVKSGWASWIVGGWGVSGVLTRMSGTPLRFTANGNSLNAPGTTQVPVQIAPFRSTGSTASGASLGGVDTALWFDPNSFQPPTGNGVLGNVARYAFSGPGFFNWDAAVFRNIPIRERVSFEFRVEAFSVTNTPQFSNPNADITSNNFGHITGVDGGNRTLELSGKITF